MKESNRKTKTVEPYWNDLVAIFFNVCKEKFNEIPSFDGSAPKDMKAIINSLRTRAENSKREWTHEVATTVWRHFLEYAYTDKWLADNFILSNINRQKDKIFFNISKQRAGK